jgi:hypothetical protein
MRQIKLTLAAVFAASIFMISCGGKKSAADLANSHCEMMKSAGEDAEKLKDAGKKAEEEMKAATKDLKPEEAEKFAKEYMEAALKCDPTKK